MTESRLIQKQLAGKEDLLLGVGTVSQTRATGVKTITKLNATHFGGVLVVDTINDLNSLDKNQLDEQVVLVKEDGNTYIYNGTIWVNKTTIVENIEDLATYTGSDLVMVKDINRGGTFISKTEVDIDPNTGSVYTVNGGTVFAKLGGGFWVRQYSGAVSITWFGALGDDLLASASINDNAILSAVATQEDVFVPKGKYHISKTICLNSNQSFFGTGKDSFFNMATDDQGSIMHMVGVPGAPVVDSYIHSLGFNANNVVNLNIIGVAYAERTQVRNIWGFNVGRKGYTAQYEVYNNLCDSCYFDGGEASRGLLSLEDHLYAGTCKYNIISNITIGVATDWVIGCEGAEYCIITNVIAEQSFRGVLLNKCHNNKLDNIQTNSTNTLIQMDGCSGNDINGVTTEKTLTNIIHNFVGSMSDGNTFRNIKGVSSYSGVMLGSLLKNSSFNNCEYETTTEDTITGGSLSNNIKFSECKITSINRCVNADTIGIEFLYNTMYTTNVGIQINNTTPRLMGNYVNGAVGNTYFMNGCLNSILVGNSYDTGLAPSLGSTPKEAANSWN